MFSNCCQSITTLSSAIKIVFFCLSYTGTKDLYYSFFLKHIILYVIFAEELYTLLVPVLTKNFVNGARRPSVHYKI
jgi:hypothetical protein